MMSKFTRTQLRRWGPRTRQFLITLKYTKMFLAVFQVDTLVPSFSTLKKCPAISIVNSKL